MAKSKELLELQKSLGAVSDALYEALSKEDDVAKMRLIYREMTEVNHRISVTASLIFHAGTKDLAAAAAGIEAAKTKLVARIKSLDKADEFVKSVAKFLGLVDSLLDLAKLGVK